MASVGVQKDNQNISYDWTKGKYDYVDTWPLMSHPASAIAILVAYWIFVLKLGPLVMDKRLPFRLTWTLTMYNAFQVALSLYMTLLYGSHLLKYGIVHSTCLMDNSQTAFKINNFVWIYAMAKTTELLDTVFFVLRKKYNQVSFLHVYHHSLMMLGTWAFLKYGATDNVIFIGCLNSAVHIIMYTYYGLAAFGTKFEKYLTWKRHITKLQLMQFMALLLFSLDKGALNTCSFPSWLPHLSRWIVTSFFILFSKFYIQSYLKDRNRRNSAKKMDNGLLTSDQTNSKNNIINS